MTQQVTKKYIYNFLDKNMKHDIALVRLDRKINETDWGLNDPNNKNTICPICLPGRFRIFNLVK